MLTTLKNAWRIPELRKKLLFTLFIIVLYRLGASILVPYVDPHLLSETSTLFSGNILQFLNMLSGGALAQATLLALGVSPYITASIVMQLLTIAIPYLERLSKEGEEGRKKITAYTRVVTVALALITSIGYAMFLDQNGWLVVEDPNFFHYMVIVACYCAGASLVMWLAEKINESGIGNGISMILFANIIAGAWSTVLSLWQLIFPATGGFRWWGIPLAILEIVVLVAIVMFIVWMTNAERRIPIQYAKRVVGRKMYGGQNTNLPIKVNMSGVMPIIFSNSIVAIPATFVMLFDSDQSSGFAKFINNFFGPNSWAYLVVFLVLLVAFAFFYIAISFNPVEVANNIKNNGGAIPGIRSGRPTIEFIKKVLNRITFIGAILIAVVAGVPMIMNNIAVMFGTDIFSALAFGGSSMMIVVGVALETFRELEAQMSLRNYKGFLDD